MQLLSVSHLYHIAMVLMPLGYTCNLFQRRVREYKPGEHKEDGHHSLASVYDTNDWQLAEAMIIRSRFCTVWIAHELAIVMHADVLGVYNQACNAADSIQVRCRCLSWKLPCSLAERRSKKPGQQTPVPSWSRVKMLSSFLCADLALARQVPL